MNIAAWIVELERVLEELKKLPNDTIVPLDLITSDGAFNCSPLFVKLQYDMDKEPYLLMGAAFFHCLDDTT